MGHMGGLINPRPWRGQYRAGFSNTGGSPKPQKREPGQKKLDNNFKRRDYPTLEHTLGTAPRHASKNIFPVSVHILTDDAMQAYLSASNCTIMTKIGTKYCFKTLLNISASICH